MSDDKVSLEFLGEQMARMQADLLGIRSDQVRLEGELRADFGRLEGKVDSLEAKVGSVDARVDSVDAKVDRLDVKVDRLDAKVDRHDASNKARFDQIQRTLATNLKLMLEAFESVRR